MADTEQSQSGLDLAVKTGTAAKPVIANESVLSQMEELYKQKLAQRNSFLQDMADASAWWSGGVEGPTRGLAMRAQTRAAQDKELEDLASRMATTRVGLAQLQRAREGIASGNVSAPTMGGAPTTSLPVGWKIIEGVPVPPEVAVTYQAYLDDGDLPKARAVLFEWAKSTGQMLNAPGMHKQEPFWNQAKGQTEQKTPYEVRRETFFGGQPPAAAPTAPAAAPTAPAAAPTAPAVSTAPAVTPTATRDIYRFENIPPELKDEIRRVEKDAGLVRSMLDRPDAAEYFNAFPLERRKAVFESRNATPINVTAPAPTQVSAVAPTVSTAPTAEPFVRQRPTKFSSPSEEKAFAEREQTRMIEEVKPAAKAAGERQAALENIRPDINNKIGQATTLLSILDETPKSVGVGYRGPVTGATLEFGKQGLPGLGKKDYEETVAAATLSQKERSNRRMFDSIATAIANEVRRDMAKGTGSVSNYETAQFEKAAGLDVKAPADVNKYFALFFAETIRAKSKLLNEWAKFKKENPKALFSDFEESGKYEEIQKEWNQRLQTHYPQLKGKELGFGPMRGTQPTPNVGTATQEELDSWNQRYGKGKK